MFNKGSEYFIESDMNNINDLFNRIFTTAKERKFMGSEDTPVETINPTGEGIKPKTLNQIDNDYITAI